MVDLFNKRHFITFILLHCFIIFANKGNAWISIKHIMFLLYLPNRHIVSTIIMRKNYKSRNFIKYICGLVIMVIKSHQNLVNAFVYAVCILDICSIHVSL